MEIRLASTKDIDGWMALARSAAADFPGMDMAQHRETALDFMRRGEAVCAAEDGKIAGGLLFSSEGGVLCFLAVDPNFRRRHIAEKMLRFMLGFMNPERDVLVTTYRESVPEGAAARAFYKRMGFAEGRLCEEFGCPVQEFVLPHCKIAENAVKQLKNALSPFTTCGQKSSYRQTPVRAFFQSFFFAILRYSMGRMPVLFLKSSAKRLEVV